MIELTQAQKDRLGKPVTAPCYLVDIELDYKELLSSREAASTASGTYETGRIRINSLNSERAQVQVRNDDYRYTVNALQGVYQRRPISIAWAYGYDVSHERWLEDSYDLDYESAPDGSMPIVMFDGFITSISDVGEWITIEASRSPVAKYPRTRVTGNTAKNVTPSGSVLVFSGETYRVEQRLK